MNDNTSKGTDKQQQETTPVSPNPAMLVKTPKLPIKVEFSQDQSQNDDISTEKDKK